MSDIDSRSISYAMVRFAERHIKAIGMTVCLLSVGGLLSFLHMPRATEPELHLSHAVVEAKLPGAFLDEIESVVARPLEKLLMESESIERVEIFMADGAVTALIEFRAGDVRVFREQVAGRLARLRSRLAQSVPGLYGPRLSNSQGEICDLLVGIRAASLPSNQLERQAEALASRFRGLSGVTHVGLIGRSARRVVVEYEDKALDQVGITPRHVQTFLQSHNFLPPGGYVDIGGKLVATAVDARLKSMEDLSMLPIRDPEMRNVTALNRLMKVYIEDFMPQFSSVSVDGTSAILLAVSRDPTTASSSFSREIQKTLDSFVEECPLPLTGTVLLDQSDQLAKDLRRFFVNLCVCVGLVLVLLLLALRFHSAVMVAITVPLTILVSMAILYAVGCTLNIVSLAALILATGMLLDNQIVIAERVDSILAGTGNGHARVVTRVSVLFAPVLAAVLTTIAGFMPTLWADTRAAEYVRDLPLVVSVVLLVSLTISFTLTPFLVAMRRDHGRMHRRLCAVAQGKYKSTLRYFTRRPRILFISVAFVVAWAALAAGGLERSFLPRVNRDMIRIDLERPQGTALSETEGVMEELRVAFRKAGIVREDCTVLAGVAMPRMSALDSGWVSGPHVAVMLCLPQEDVDWALKRMRESMAGIIPADSRIRFRALAAGVQVDWPLVLSLTGDNPDELMAAASYLEKCVASDPEFTHVHSDGGDPVERYRVVPLREELAMRNVTAADLAYGMQAVLTGIPVQRSLHTDEGMLPIFIRARTGARTPLRKIKSAYIYPLKGDPTLLNEVADVRTETGPASIARQDGRYRIQVLADVKDEASCYGLDHRFADEIQELMRRFPGVSSAVLGKDRMAQESMKEIYRLLPWVIALMAVIVLMQTGSFRGTILVIVMIPFALVGSLAALRLSGEPYGFMALVGMMGVTGIVLNNGLVMLDHIRLRATQREWSRKIVLDAASERFPAVILTSLCLVASCMTLIYNGSAMWRPLAVSMAGGSVFALIPILFLLPILARRF